MNKLKEWYEMVKSGDKWVWGFLVVMLVVIGFSITACDVKSKIGFFESDKARSHCNDMVDSIAQKYDISPEPGWDFCNQIVGSSLIFNETPPVPETSEPSPSADQ